VWARREAGPHGGLTQGLPLMPLAKLILWRIALGIVTLLLVSILIFLATNALPGDPARAILGARATPEALAELRSQLGLDKPVITRYGVWLGDFVTGDLGQSLAGMKQPVSEVIGRRLYNSMILVLLASLISVPLSMALGSYTALKRDTKLDSGVTVGTLTLAALPEFVIGIALILLLSTQALHLFPPISRLNPFEPMSQQLDAFILPVLTLTLAVLPYISRMMRASTIEVLESEYISMARLKGVPEPLVMRRHTLPNAVVPAIQGTAMQLAWLAGGIVVVEYLFSYPGIGSALVDAVANRDYPVIQALVLIMASVYVVLNLIADILTILITPRLRTGMR
jgi:peptide/nickel transport system permease protein